MNTKRSTRKYSTWLVAAILGYVAFGVCACTNQAAKLENGVYRFKHHKQDEWSSRLALIVEDTMMFIYPLHLSSEECLMNLTTDSITLPNPCFEDRAAYENLDNSLLIDSSYVLSLADSITPDMLFFYEGASLHLPSKELAKPIFLDRVDDVLSIVSGNNDFNRFFPNEHQLMIDDLYSDSTDFSDWINHLREGPIPRTVAIYIDTGFPETSQK